MATLEQLYKQRAALREQTRELEEQIKTISTEMTKVNTQIDLLNFPCSCVRLNVGLDIWNIGLQESRNRNGLTVGFPVADTLSADRSCPICHGTGVPK
jgi:hypothetical protein